MGSPLHLITHNMDANEKNWKLKKKLALKNPDKLEEIEKIKNTNLSYAKQSLDQISNSSDIDENKQTILAIVARKINMKDWDSFLKKTRKFEDYKNYFESNGVKKEVENLIESNVEKALTGLSMLSDDRSVQLNKYANLILNREF